jgi:hypothetical protein
MKFENKVHMALELIAGKRFKKKDGSGYILHYDECHTIPFRYGEEPALGIWKMYGEDVWEEVTTHLMPIVNGPWDLCQRVVVEVAAPHVHQHLIDSYTAGQAWQFMASGTKDYCDCKRGDSWIEPEWNESTAYRLHPHNDLIQAHTNGAKIQAYICGDWVEEPNPDWYTDTEYRIKPATKVVHEWAFKSKLNDKWTISSVLFTEEEAKDTFRGHEYHQTGRSWEVDA